ncbi:DUF2768 domain-containing protein [Bacillus methanolicus]|uniref:DUF2768 domain-containing protein n=1 Tax=Bacillus methanolicus TaxID=1471 RepID=UPI0023804C04|nr:DUF2768 domain-containing protein [Bacillus methanolicus]MDE3839411.1 DUF2768 domain-containing protein [Bacillus methanolicus]
MSPALMKMWISFGAMGFMFLSMISIYFSRYKLKGVIRIITALIAYVLLILSGIIIFLIVFSGPTSE